MSIDTFEKGESIPRTVTLSEDGTVRDTSEFLTIEVAVFSFIHNTIGTYTVLGGTVTKISPTTGGQIFFVVPSSVTANSRGMKYYYRIETTETDITYPDNIKTLRFLGWLFDLKVTK